MKKNILIFDDDIEFIKLYMEILKDEFNITYVMQLEDALSILDNNRYHFDLILCDIFMPNINGFEVFDFFNSQEKYTHLNFVFKTSSLNESVIEESIINKKKELISTYMSPKEVIARLKKAILNASYLKVTNGNDVALVINKNTGKLICPELQIPLIFTQTEVRLLNSLAHSTSPIPKKELLETVFYANQNITNNNFNTTLTNLRKKTEEIGISISNKRNIGAMLVFN